MDRDFPLCTGTDNEETCQPVRSKATDPDLPLLLASAMGPGSQDWGMKTPYFMPGSEESQRKPCAQAGLCLGSGDETFIKPS